MTTIISDKQVRDHFSMSRCIEAVEKAFTAAGRGVFAITERKLVSLPDRARLHSLTAASSNLGRLVANIYTGAPAGHDKRTSPVNRRQKLYILFEADTGACEAIISGGHLAWLKTGAMGAVAIKHLSSPTARRLAVIGTGRQARTALEGAMAVRPFEHIRVWGPTRANAERMVSEFPDIPGLATADSAREAVDGAEVIVTATTAKEPVIEATWLADGFHINSIGAHYPRSREIDGETIGKSTVIVDTLVAAKVEKGELLLAEEEGHFSFDEVAGELGEVVAGESSWRRSKDENTVFASCGSAIESLGAAIGVLDAIPNEERQVFRL